SACSSPAPWPWCRRGTSTTAASTAPTSSGCWPSRGPKTLTRSSFLKGSHRPACEDEVRPRLRLVGEVPQQVSRVVGDDAGAAGVAMHPPAQTGDAGVGLEERLRREAPHGEDELGVHQLDLAQQVRGALRHLIGL